MFSIQYALSGIQQHSSNKESLKIIMIRTFLNWSHLVKLLECLYQLYIKLDKIKSIPLIMSLSGPRSSLSLLGTNLLCNLHWSMIIEQQKLTISCYLFLLALVRKQERKFENILLASKPKVIKASSKLDITIVQLNIWDLQNGSKTKLLINYSFNFGCHITTIRGTNINSSYHELP